MGFSMMSPLGLAMRPRTPASWRTCWRLPRAPESTIRETGLYSSLSWLVSRVRNMTLAIWSVQWVQMSMTLL